MASTNQTPRTRRHRSTVACQACRQRKVRCSLTVTGVPCAGCTQDAIECIVNRKQGKGTQQTDSLAPRRRRQGHSSAIDSHIPTSAASANPAPCPIDERRPSGLPPCDTQAENTTRTANGSPSDFEVYNMADEERNALEIASAALGQPDSVGEIHFYTGEQTGPTSALNICSPNDSLPKHFLVPLHRTHLSDEDQNFLRRKGVFTLPGKSACDSMIEAYLVHVHPILPVIEADVLVEHHQAGQLQDYNLLLLWSLFFVAVNFIPAAIYEEEGFTSRRAMKFMMYSRAKCLYNNGNERNKIALLQSSLLMGFWHSDMDEHAQPWYWTGIAINLGQILGLHRDPGASSHTSSITDRQRSFWCRLWWCCFFRDRWLGLTLGRPLRVNLDDCDIRMPLAGDLLFDTLKPDGSPIASYLPGDMNRLAEYWVMLMELSCLLGNTLALNRRPARLKASIDEVEGLERRLLQSRLPDQYEVGLTRVARFYSHHVHLHYQAMVITFYRRWETEAPDGLTPPAKDDWQHRIRLRAHAAASRTNEILDMLVQENLLGFAGPMTPPLLVPAMQVHLLQCKFGDSIAKRIRLSKLEMCMLVLEEFQKTYTVASVYRGIFTKALQQIVPGYSAPTMRESPAATAIPAPANESYAPGAILETEDLDANNGKNDQLDDLELAAAYEPDLMNILMDEGSIFDFWQTWNQM
ncbi:fungal-specific transcription factor domain-containing protein [Aspergillus novoparasiticus]|uniref:Fungal-specific transcription factor domain-containing protein n=1 Tax=Aspergillus novoparasiticus TaxID=986946 RepID=A0A5N6EMQ1_9EURO|nr:fungal-specific transcription factor domain-containing protein [Aspergillus novoparasiticus]